MSHSVNTVLTQIRSYQTQVSGLAADAMADAPVNNTLTVGLSEPVSNQPSFTETLRGALGAVNQSQAESSQLARAFELGDPTADLAKVMVAAQHSQIAFKATVEIRNRLVQAYQDVMNMPL
jgi:flagellar hook-basal body complex protein FliE